MQTLIGTSLPALPSKDNFKWNLKFIFSVLLRFLFTPEIIYIVVNPLLPSVPNIGRLTKILISIKEGIIKKISAYERRAYERRAY